MKPILIVEDEPNIRNLIALTLRRAGYATQLAADGIQAADMIEENQYDLVLLDVMLPGVDGFELIDYILPTGTPVIFLTAKAGVNDRVKGLRLGADDYIVKPFEPAELLARVESVLRRAGRGSTVLRVGDVEMDPVALTVTKGGVPVHLKPMEYNLLAQLMRNPGVALYRSVLYERVWGSEPEEDTRTLDIHIQRLRKKLDWADTIETVRGVGYRLKGNPK